MAQTNTVYDPNADEEPVHHRSPAEEDELKKVHSALGMSPEDSRIDNKAVHDGEDSTEKGKETDKGDSGLFNPSGDGDKGDGEAAAATAGAEEGFFKPGGDQTKRSRAKSKLSKISSKKGLLVGGSGAGIIAIILILLLLLASSLKIPNLAQNITSYEFARLTRQFDDNAQQVTDEDLALESVEDPAETSLLRQTYDNAADMWSKLDNYRPSKVIENLGQNNDLHLTVGAKGGITGTLDEVPFTMADQGITRYIPGVSSVVKFKNQLQFSQEFAPALEDALAVNEVGPIIRGAVANNIRKELGISLIAWYVGKYQGENAAEARLTEEGEKIDAVDGGDTPPLATGDVEELNNAETAADQAAETAESSPAGLQDIVNNGGIVKGVTTAIGTSLQNTPFQDVVSIADPIAKFATPACIIYDGSLNNSGSSIDNQAKQQQSAFYYVATAADQQKAGSNNSIDPSGDGLATAVNAANDDVGDITQSNAYIRASGGAVNTDNSVSAEGSADDEFTFFNAIPGMPSILTGFLNGTASSLCPVLTNTYVQIGIAIGNILNQFIPGEDVEADAGEAALETAGTEVTENVIDKESQSLVSTLLSKVVGDKVAGYTTKVGAMLGDGAKNAAAIAGLTIFAKLIVMSRSGAINSGTAQGVDLANEADSGGNIQANELERTQLFGRPMLENEVCVSNQDDQSFVAYNESRESAFDRYLAPSNTTSLLSRTAVAVGGNFNGSLGDSMLHLGSDLLHPLSLVGSLSNLFFGRALAATNCDNVSTDYGNIQFGWSDDEEALINSNSSYSAIENEQILDNSGQEAAIAKKYAVCFGYTYNASGDGSFDPTDAAGDLQLADGPGDPASLGTLLSSDGQNGKILYIERDSDGNIINDPSALCSPINLSYNSPDALAADNNSGSPKTQDMIFRWRLAMEDDTTIDQLTNEQTTT